MRGCCGVSCDVGCCTPRADCCARDGSNDSIGGAGTVAAAGQPGIAEKGPGLEGRVPYSCGGTNGGPLCSLRRRPL